MVGGPAARRDAPGHAAVPDGIRAGPHVDPSPGVDERAAGQVGGQARARVAVGERGGDPGQVVGVKAVQERRGGLLGRPGGVHLVGPDPQAARPERRGNAELVGDLRGEPAQVLAAQRAQSRFGGLPVRRLRLAW